MSSGVFPDLYKTSIVKPLLKKGDETVVSNYRPISLIPAISKVLESTVNDQLTHYMSAKKILTDAQYGFRKNRSTTEATFKLVNSINQILESKNIPLVILCDLSKAFDCVDFDILLNKLSYYGIRGSANDWFSSYLKSRKLVVEIPVVSIRISWPKKFRMRVH